MFEADFARLTRVLRVLRWSRWTAGAVTLLCLGSAAALWPGPYGRGLAFSDVQIHMDLMRYFAALGVETWHHNDAAILGVHFAQLRPVLALPLIFSAILALAGLFRLRWREFLGYGAVWFLMFSVINIPAGADEINGWELAIPQEFGVRPAALMFALPKADEKFAAVGERLGDARVAGLKQIEQYYASQPHDRLVRAAKIRAEFSGNMSDLVPLQKAAMHYMAAQVSYLEQDYRATRTQLNAISSSDFQATNESNYRIRHMQEWVESTGRALPPGAYRPQTGWPLSLLRLVAKGLAIAGIAAFFGYGTLAGLCRKLAARMKRMRQMAQELSVIGPAFEPAAPFVVQNADVFSKRAVKPASNLETEISA